MDACLKGVNLGNSFIKKKELVFLTTLYVSHGCNIKTFLKWLITHIRLHMIKIGDFVLFCFFFGGEDYLYYNWKGFFCLGSLFFD